MDPNLARPEAAASATLLGRAWVSGDLPGPAVVIIRGDEVIDVTAVTPTVSVYMRQHIPVDDRRSILFGWRAYGTDRTKGPDHTQNGWNLTDIDGQTERPSYEAAQRKAGDFEAQGSIWYGVARPDIEHRGTTDAGVVMMRRLLREILEGDVPTAWPKPAGSNGDKPKAQNILAQDSVINVNRRADADEDWDLLTKAGEEITEVVIEGSNRFDDDERVDWIVARIKEIEAKYRG